MSNPKAMAFMQGLQLGDTKLEGEVLLPIILGFTTKAADVGGSPNPRIEIEVALPPDACPDPDDVRWLTFQPELGGRLRRMIVLLEFEPGTLRHEEQGNGR